MFSCILIEGVLLYSLPSDPEVGVHISEHLVRRRELGLIARVLYTHIPLYTHTSSTQVRERYMESKSYQDIHTYLYSHIPLYPHIPPYTHPSIHMSLLLGANSA